MDECERRVRRMGKARIVLHTTHLMSIARAWYERSGYSRFEAIDFSPVPGHKAEIHQKIVKDASARVRAEGV
jgi:hypothetical protein